MPAPFLGRSESRLFYSRFRAVSCVIVRNLRISRQAPNRGERPRVIGSIIRPAACVRPLALLGGAKTRTGGSFCARRRPAPMLSFIKLSDRLFIACQNSTFLNRLRPGSKVGKCYSKLSIRLCVVGESIARGGFLPCARCRWPGSAPPCRAAGRAHETTGAGHPRKSATMRRSLKSPPIALSHSHNPPSYNASAS